MEDLSALYRPSPADRKGSKSSTQVLSNWHIDDSQGSEKSAEHSNFNAGKGELTTPNDGLYSVVVELIPTDGGANVSGALSRRKEVAYIVRVEEPPAENADDSDDEAEGIKFLDVGPMSFGEVMHLRAGTKISVCMLPNVVSRESVRIKIEIVQRKRKRGEDRELSKKERKKRKKELAAANKEAESSDWSSQFSSDESSDELPHSKKGVSRLAKEVKKTV